MLQETRLVMSHILCQVIVVLQELHELLILVDARASVTKQTDELRLGS